ncbi:MAG: mechanosensitive ion channel family protein [Sandaracinaceae bacterium]|nr:mechanosensitive ion channel family protein [Sandaracinaceae bacterium]
MRHCLVAAISAAILSTCAAPAARAQVVHPGEADCSTPRRALLTWLGNLQRGSEHPEQAVRCFDWEAARVADPAERIDRARRFKRVLDARGLYVEMDDIPDEAAPDDVTRVVPFPNNLPDFGLVRRGEEWVIDAETIQHVPGWYDETFAFEIDHVLDALPEWTQEEALGAAWWQWLGLALLLLSALLVRMVVSFAVETQGTKLLTSLVKRLKPELLRRAALPIGTVAMTFFLMYAFPLLGFGVGVNRVVAFGLRAAAAVSSVLIVYRLVDVVSDVMAKRAERTATKLDDQLVPLVRKSLKVVTVVLGVIFVLQNMEVDVASLIAGVSLGGLAFTLAARDTVANLFGSLSIFADQPFQVGDWVVMQGVEGVVEEVGMRSTRVRTFYRSLVSIPNSKVADGIIDNYGARDSRRTFIKLGVQYDTTPEQMEAFCDGVRADPRRQPEGEEGRLPRVLQRLRRQLARGDALLLLRRGHLAGRAAPAAPRLPGDPAARQGAEGRVRLPHPDAAPHDPRAGDGARGRAPPGGRGARRGGAGVRTGRRARAPRGPEDHARLLSGRADRRGPAGAG